MSLALKGSTRTVSEFFEYAINSILYQRAVYPPEDFTMVKKYNLNLLVSHHEDLTEYIRSILKQLHRWLLMGKVNKLVMHVVNKDDGEVVEKWEFNVTLLGHETEGDDNKTRIQKEIQALIRQITASVTFLPELESGDYTFNVQAYTEANAVVPAEWADAPETTISNSEQLQFKSFTTSNHKVDACVSYKTL